ncbi:MAG: UPF0104 family protein [Pseudonocardiaceae bacterium]|nr:UPF0104 family protein [Pseudonocardiaceae bacterium]
MGASTIRRTFRRTFWAWARLGCGAAILAVLVGRLGAEPFLDAFRLVSAWSLGVAVAVTALTTVCCAWRWSLVAGGLGVDVRLPWAVAAYYRSQFLNTTLPGGVVGDVHRGVRQGRDVGVMGRSLRSVAWERTLGQAVQIVLTGLVLLVLPSAARSIVLVAVVVVAAAGVAVAGVVLVAKVVPRGGQSRGGRSRDMPGLGGRIVRTVADDLRNVLVVSRAWPGIVLASGVAATGHVVIFLVAARAAGTDASAAQVLPLAMIVLLASAIPMNIAGWGPREGVAAWVFTAAGLGAAQGVTTAVLYGVLVLVATLPGAAVLVAARQLREAGRQGASRPDDQRLEGATLG